MEKKHFEQWIDLKARLHFGNSSPKISEGDIWWCGCGENVGVEINGKSSRFSRPVLIKKRQFVALCQARVMSVSRLYDKIGQIPKSDLDKVKAAFVKLYE